jgi:hypothetical protein
MNTEQPKIQLQTVGWVPADQVGNLNVGDRIMWNGGNISEVTDVEQVSRCFRLISLKSSETGKQEGQRRLKNTSLVARIPQAKEEAPAAEPAEETGPISAAEIVAEYGPDALKEAEEIAREVFAEVDVETAKEKEAARTLPTLEGHTVRVTLKGHMWTVTLYDGSTGDELFSDKIGDHVDDGPAYAAKALIRAREGDLKEAAALAALDDTTAYVALRSDAVAAEGVTAEEAREILRQARQEAGPEPLRDYGAPRMTLRHSGAFWSATVHAYAANGNRLPFKNRRVTIVPDIVHAAGTVIMDRTGDGLVYPVAKPSIHAFGPWVRPVPGHADQVIVSRVANGLHQRPQSDLASIPWEEHTQAYQNAMEGAGWALVERTDDGDVYSAPR